MHAERPLLEGEARAFHMLYGTTDIHKIKEIEKNPAAYWREREQALLHGKDKAVPHREFCAKFVKDAQAFITQTLGLWPWPAPTWLNTIVSNKPWYTDFNALDHLLHVTIKDHPALPTVKALAYACIVDDLQDPGSCAENLKTPQDFCRHIRAFMAEPGHKITEDLNHKQRWFISEDGVFSLFDSLVMRGNGLYLCGAASHPEKHSDFAAHYRGGKPHFSKWTGVIAHDSVTHALKQEQQANALQALDIDDQEYFDACYAPSNLPQGDIITLSEKTQGVFHNFHEACTVSCALDEDDIFSVAFPSSRSLVDTGFLDITPYFAEKNSPLMPSPFNWHDCPLLPAALSEEQVHTTLIELRDKFCIQAFSTIAQG